MKVFRFLVCGIWLMAAHTWASTYSEWRPDPATMAGLNQEFSAVCGDTFCEGDFSNLSTLDIVCVVNDVDNIKSCRWVFGGSYNVVGYRTGEIATTGRVFICDLGLSGAKAAVEAFFKVAAQGKSYADGLTTSRIPGSDSTLYQKLNSCL